MRALLAGSALLFSTPAAAEVVNATDAGFEIALSDTIARPPGEVWAALRTPARWWEPSHSWSGDAANLWMDSQAGGCFCEKLPDRGSAEHARVVYAAPGKMLRLNGLLGPLQSEAGTGILTWTLEPVEGGTKLSVTYVVNGRLRMGAEKIAPAVNGVLDTQIKRLKAFVEAAPN